MRRLTIAVVAGVAGIALLGLALAGTVAAGGAHMGGGWNDGGHMGDRWSGTGNPVTIAQARERASKFLDDAGFDDLAVAEVMEFSNHFYAAVTDPTTGDGAFELLISRDGRNVHPEPTMMWNVEHNPMFGARGEAFHRGMMNGSMMSGGMWNGGMMGGGMMGDQGCQAGMQGIPGTTEPLDQPLTVDEAVTTAQAWLDANRSGLTASDPIAFPGYVTLHVERDGQIVGMLSVQTTTGAVWEHTWHGDFLGIEHSE